MTFTPEQLEVVARGLGAKDIVFIDPEYRVSYHDRHNGWLGNVSDLAASCKKVLREKGINYKSGWTEFGWAHIDFDLKIVEWKIIRDEDDPDDDTAMILAFIEWQKGREK